MTTLGQYGHERDNHFNLIRMIAATGVLISHAWPIALGSSTTEPLSRVLGLSLGTVSVYVFFAISGFFIAQSFDRSSSFQRFLQARVLRIFPALLVMLGLTVLTGWTLTDADIGTYIASAASYMMRNATLFFLQYPLPGLFQENPYGPTINGSLWTLNYEILCYIGVVLIGVLGCLRKQRLLMFGLLGLGVLCYALAEAELMPNERLSNLGRLALPFIIGSALYAWREWIVLDKRGVSETLCMRLSPCG